MQGESPWRRETDKGSDPPATANSPNSLDMASKDGAPCFSMRHSRLSMSTQQLFTATVIPSRELSQQEASCSASELRLKPQTVQSKQARQTQCSHARHKNIPHTSHHCEPNAKKV